MITIYNLTVLVPSIAVAVRRMHDVGKSGWYALIPVYSIILAATEGEKGQIIMALQQRKRQLFYPDKIELGCCSSTRVKNTNS